MPSTISAVAPDVISQEKLRTFHISGRGLDQAMPRYPLRPADLDCLPQLPRVESAYPVYISAQFECGPLAGPNAAALWRAFRDAAPGKDLIPIAEYRDRVVASLDCAPDKVPQYGWLVPFSANALPLLYAATVTASRSAARVGFLGKMTRQCERLRELLRLDDSHSPAGSSPEVISSAMGAQAAYIDASVLANAFHRTTEATPQMEPKRRERVEALLATLEHAIDETEREPAFWLFHSATVPPGIEALGGQLRQCGDSFHDALEFCDQRLLRFTRYLRTMRAARLEADSAFDSAVHEEWLRRFDWQTADPDELAALPAFVVLEPAEWLARTSLASFGRLLRSGRPVQILAPYQVLESADTDGDLSGFMPDFGYLSIAHREAFVLQTSLANMEHLQAGLSAMAQSLRPGVAIVSVPAARISVATEASAWLESTLLYLSRAFPLYRYDPDRGDSWMERFELLAGPQPAALTAVHAAAVSNEFRRHFRVIPDSDWNDDQMELAEYLKRYRQTPPLAIPFLWVTDDYGRRQRAVVTRDLVNLARDRQRAFRIFEELAGVNNAHVEAAVVRTRDEVHAGIRIEGATEAIHRVIAMLTGGEALAPPPAAVPTVTQQATPEPTASAAPSEVSEDPYIDTFLCTSCNDCMKVNAMVFQYDANKQAYIGNARAGTFAELVKAAEGCPAKCIHPGAPRPDDKTATPAVRARAAKFQ